MVFILLKDIVLYVHIAPEKKHRMLSFISKTHFVDVSVELKLIYLVFYML